MNDDNLNQKPKESNPGQGSTKKYRRAVFPVLDSKFQFKVTIACVMFILASHLFLYFIHSHAISTTATEAAGKYGMQLESFLEEQKVILMKKLGLAVLFICIVVALTVFSLTKKVAGPLFNFSRVFEEIAKGKLDKRVRLRTNDEFKWFAEKFNTMMDALEERFKKG